MPLPWALIAPSQKYAQRLVARMALACAGAAAGAVGLGFATYAFFAALRAQYGAVEAAAAIAATYLILAGILLAWRGVIGSTASRGAPTLPTRLAADASQRTAKQLQTDAAQAATLALGMEVSRQLTPVQLILVAALTGFVAGRKI
jgi:hypothetical protein